jgi:hypothetical protein
MTPAKAAKAPLSQGDSRHERTFSVFPAGEVLGLELSMRPTIAVAIVLVLFLSGSANGADLIQLAETSSVLLGNAYRCGVPTDRVEHAGQVMTSVWDGLWKSAHLGEFVGEFSV